MENRPSFGRGHAQNQQTPPTAKAGRSGGPSLEGWNFLKPYVLQAKICKP